MSKFFYNKQSDNKDLREEAFYCDRVQNSYNAQKKGNKRPYWLVNALSDYLQAIVMLQYNN